MIDKISNSFQKVFDAIDECIEEVRGILIDYTHEVMKQTIYEVSKFKEELEKKKIKRPNYDLRNDCITFLRDYNIKESYKGTEFVIYALLNHHSSENIKFANLVKEIVEVYKIPSHGVHSVRGNLNNALKSVDEEFITPKECLYFLLREWELYKQEKGLE